MYLKEKNLKEISDVIEEINKAVETSIKDIAEHSTLPDLVRVESTLAVMKSKLTQIGKAIHMIDVLITKTPSARRDEVRTFIAPDLEVNIDVAVDELVEYLKLKLDREDVDMAVTYHQALKNGVDPLEEEMNVSVMRIKNILMSILKVKSEPYLESLKDAVIIDVEKLRRSLTKRLFEILLTELRSLVTAGEKIAKIVSHQEQGNEYARALGSAIAEIRKFEELLRADMASEGEYISPLMACSILEKYRRAVAKALKVADILEGLLKVETAYRAEGIEESLHEQAIHFIVKTAEAFKALVNMVNLLWDKLKSSRITYEEFKEKFMKVAEDYIREELSREKIRLRMLSKLIGERVSSLDEFEQIIRRKLGNLQGSDLKVIK